MDRLLEDAEDDVPEALLGYDTTSAWFDWGTFSLFTYLVSTTAVLIGHHRKIVKNSPYWSASEERLDKAYVDITHASLAAIFIFLSLLVLFGTLVALATRGLDPRMISIINGIAYFEAAIILLILSWHIPKWTGMYHYVGLDPADDKDLGTTDRVLRYNTFMDIGKKFARVFFLQLLMFCGVNAGMIPISAAAGIIVAFLIDASVYRSRRAQTDLARNGVAIITALCMIGFSYLLFVFGILFIIEVWGVTAARGQDIAVLVLSVIYWTVAVAIHGTTIYRTRKHTKKHGPTDHTRHSSMENTGRDRMAMSLIMSKREKKKAKKQAKFHNNLDTVAEDEQQKDFGEADGGANDIEEANDNNSEEAPPANIFQENNENEELAMNGNEDDDDDDGPTYCELLCNSLRCCCCKKPNGVEADQAGEEIPLVDKILDFCSTALWVIVSCGLLVMTIINVGATIQGNRTKTLIGPAQQELYPPNYNTDFPVCASDDQGPASTIKSFPNKDAARAEGFKVLHCGACGACSDWGNLRAEWYTRTYLAEKSRDCAVKSLFGGGPAVTSCLEKGPIAFQGECAECWTTDVLCTKKYCSFIYLQSNLINTVSNLQVKPGQVTSALCEEANCELENGVGSNETGFVDCSGATRRRMAIRSTIRRPKWQQCTSVEFDWNAEFGDCCETSEDYTATAPKWEELDSEGLVWSDKYGPPTNPCEGMTACNLDQPTNNSTQA